MPDGTAPKPPVSLTELMCVGMMNGPSPTEVLAKRCRAYRLWREWSADELGRRCREAGLEKWNRSVVANLESGRRQSTSVDEVLVLAYVLGVPPVMMFIPLGEAPEVEITPKLRMHPWMAARWVMGRPHGAALGLEFPGATPLDDDQRSTWARANLPVELYMDLEDAIQMFDRMERRIEKTVLSNVVGELKKSRPVFLSRIVEALDKMVEAGLTPPILSHDVAIPMLDEGLAPKHPEALRVMSPDGNIIEFSQATPPKKGARRRRSK